jgi:hypothetical protein
MRENLWSARARSKWIFILDWITKGNDGPVGWEVGRLGGWEAGRLGGRAAGRLGGSEGIKARCLCSGSGTDVVDASRGRQNKALPHLPRHGSRGPLSQGTITRRRPAPTLALLLGRPAITTLIGSLSRVHSRRLITRHIRARPFSALVRACVRDCIREFVRSYKRGVRAP